MNDQYHWFCFIRNIPCGRTLEYVRSVPTILRSGSLLIGILALFLFHPSYAQPVSSQHSEPANIRLYPYDQQIRYQLIKGESGGFGYDIYVNSTLFIHQARIPCLPGKKGFKTKADAKKVATLVMTKIKNGLTPPTVTISEMQKLGIDLR